MSKNEQRAYEHGPRLRAIEAGGRSFTDIMRANESSAARRSNVETLLDPRTAFPEERASARR